MCFFLSFLVFFLQFSVDSKLHPTSMCSGTLPPSLVPDINDKDQSESRSTLNPEEEGGKNNHRSDRKRERERKGKESVGKKRQ